MANDFSRGSEWRKWDLHVHTPASILYNGFGSDWDTYVKNLFKTLINKEISVVGITDYFTVDGYQKIKEEYLANNSKLQALFSEIEIEQIKKILILPNIEFRSDTFVGAKSVNFHIIFSESIPVRDIEEKFLHEIDFVYQGEPQTEDRKRKLREVNLIELGRRLKGEHSEFRESELCVGMMNAVVDHKQVSKILFDKEETFGSKCLFIVMADEDLGEISWNSRDHLTRKVLIQKSDLLFSSNGNTRNWGLGKLPYADGQENFLNEFRTLKPCIHGSDAHEFKFIGHPCDKRGDSTHDCSTNLQSCQLRYCWIKSDPTFEGLRQILYEPECRVYIGSNNPTDVKSGFTIDKVKISNGEINREIKISDTEIDLNHDLVAVTGGKGSGKTAFVDLVANCYVDRTVSSDKNSFVGRILNGQTPNIKTSIKLINDTEFSKKVFERILISDSSISYIAQGELESYIDAGSNISEHIHNIVFNSSNVQNSVAKYDYISASEDTSDIAIQLEQCCVKVDELEKETRVEVVDEIRAKRKLADSELKAVSEKISEIEKGLNPETIINAKNKQEELGKHKTRLEKLQTLRSKLKEVSGFVDAKLPLINSMIGQVNKLLSELNIPSDIGDVVYIQKDNLNDKLTLIDKEVKNEVIKVENVQVEINKFQAGTRDHAKLLDSRREMEIVAQKLAVQEAGLGEMKKRLEEMIKNRKGFFKNLIERILSQKKQYDIVIESFSTGIVEVLSDLQFEAEVKMDFNTLSKLAEEILDNRKIDLDPHSSEWALKPLRDLYLGVAQGDETKLNTLVSEVERLNTDSKSKVKQSSIVASKHYHQLFYGNYLSVSPVVKYKNTSITNLSLGQKATVLIKIYLAQGDNPIIIDSHDDHLDNEFIMSELVEALREAKKHRQVIIVSNNGNVVVNSDAEQLIISNRDGCGSISYISGSLENPQIRDRALAVLEGGYDAFNKRQQKYRINK